MKEVQLKLQDKAEFIKEFFRFLKEKKAWILVPVLIMIFLIITITVFIEVPVLLPFFYAVF